MKIDARILLLLGGAIAACGSPDPAADPGPADAGPEAAAPAPPPAWPPTNLQAMHFVNFGDLGPGAVADPEGWRAVGLNLDGLEGSAAEGLRCQPQPGVSPQVQERGNQGIENSFGRNVIPVLGQNDPISLNVDDSIRVANETFLFAFYALPSTADAPDLQAALLLGQGPRVDGSLLPGGDPNRNPVTPPDSAWADGSVIWDLVSTTVATPDPLVPLSLFRGSLRSQQWVSERFDLPIIFPFRGVSMPLHLYRSTFQGTFSTDHRALHEGVLAGTFSTEEFTTQFTKVAPRISSSFCSPSTVEFVNTTVFRAASDILLDGTQDPNRACDGISFGMAFEAVLAQPGAVVTADPPGSPGPCESP